MAQMAEWLVRIEGSKYSTAPALAEDAYQWWCGWARRIARRGVDAVTPTDVFTIAKRSIRPASAAGHHRYWQRSLAEHPADDIVQQVATMLAISRRTVFNRLRRAKKMLAEFYREPDAARALYDFLKETPPNTHRLSDARRAAIESLQEAGLSSEAARKLERRTHELPPAEQHRRLQAAIERHRRRRLGQVT
jgi:hypothetical protein